MAEAMVSERHLLWQSVCSGPQQAWLVDLDCGMSSHNTALDSKPQPLLHGREDCTIAWLELLEALASASEEDVTPPAKSTLRGVLEDHYQLVVVCCYSASVQVKAAGERLMRRARDMVLSV